MRKMFVLVIVAISTIQLPAQNCSEYIKKVKDKFSDRVSIETEPMIIEDGKKKLAVAFVYSKKVMHLVFISNEKLSIDCVDNGAVVKFLFDDGTKAQEANSYEFNCKGTFDLIFYNYGLAKRGNRERFLNFVNKRLTDVRLNFNDEIRDFSFSKDVGDTFKEVAGCMYDAVYGDKNNEE